MTMLVSTLLLLTIRDNNITRKKCCTLVSDHIKLIFNTIFAKKTQSHFARCDIK